MGRLFASLLCTLLLLGWSGPASASMDSWGYNGNGQLGDGTTTDRLNPVPVSGLSEVTAIAGGIYHSLALLADGTVRAWGRNNFGQLGDGTTTDRLTPGPVSNLGGVVAIAEGYDHSLALLTDGTVRAWGNNEYGQLGDGSTIGQLTPVPVSGLSGVVAIAGGQSNSLALLTDGTVRAWGRNNFGELGDGTRTDRLTPGPVTGLSGVVAIVGGYEHNLALLTNGTMRAWGNNSEGMLGDGTTTDRLTPVPVSSLSGVVAIAGSFHHSLALLPDGTVRAWGRNADGQLGDGTTTNRSTPVPVNGLSGVVAVAGGLNHSLALLPDGTVRAWGYNGQGQLGDGTTTARHTPGPVSSLSAVVAIAGGVWHSLAISTASSLPTVTVTATTPTATEAGPTNGVFTITRTGGSTVPPLSVNLMVSGTATAGSDYYAPGNSMTIPAGQTSVTLQVVPINDAVPEPDETAILTLAAGSGYTVGSPSSATVTILSAVTVAGTNRDPILTPIGAKNIAEGAPLAVTVSATDPDGDLLTYSATGLPPGATFDAPTRTFTWTPTYTQAGSYVVTFSVSDGKAPAMIETVTITVTDTNRPPVLTPVGNKTSSEGSTLAFTVSATDPDGDLLTYSATGLPPGATFDAPTRTFTWTPTYTQAGSYVVTFSVSDGTAPPVTETILITVTDTNRLPILTPIGAKSITEGARLTFIVGASDPDGDPLTYSASGLPTGATFTAAAQTFTWIPSCAQAGSYAVTFSVSDGTVPPVAETVLITVTDTYCPRVLVLKSGAGIGTVTSIPAGIACGSTCAANLPLGSGVILQARPEPGSAFTGWFGACTGMGACILAMNSPQTVFAAFNPPPLPQIHLGVEPGDRIARDPMTVTATIIPDTPTLADVYIALELPDTNLLCLRGDGSLTPACEPLVATWPVSVFTGPVFSHTFAGGEPAGTYRWLAALMAPGTLTPLTSITEASASAWPAPAPGLTLALSHRTIRPGDSFGVGLSLETAPTPVDRDVYVAIQLPDGTLLFLDEAGQATPTATPYLRNWDGTALVRKAFAYLFTGGEPAGTYKVLAAFATPGTLNFIDPIVTAPFSFAP